jgi:cytochrome P450
MQVIEGDIERILSGEAVQHSDNPSLLSLLKEARPLLSARHMRDEVLTMLTAGHETTAVTLCWSWYSILTHPLVADRFYREIDEVLGKRVVTAADLPRLRYTRMIVDEALRMYPPVWIVARVALRDDASGRFPIPARAGVLVSPYLIHRRPERWPAPDEFRPERFASGSEVGESYGYLPFLAGRHLCLGKYFALTEVVTVLATIAQRYRFKLCDQPPVAFDPGISLRMRDDLMVIVERT